MRREFWIYFAYFKNEEKIGHLIWLVEWHHMIKNIGLVEISLLLATVKKKSNYVTTIKSSKPFVRTPIFFFLLI